MPIPKIANRELRLVKVELDNGTEHENNLFFMTNLFQEEMRTALGEDTRELDAKELSMKASMFAHENGLICIPSEIETFTLQPPKAETK